MRSVNRETIYDPEKNFNAVARERRREKENYFHFLQQDPNVNLKKFQHLLTRQEKIYTLV
jgi:hypothetical protein